MGSPAAVVGYYQVDCKQVEEEGEEGWEEDCLLSSVMNSRTENRRAVPWQDLHLRRPWLESEDELL